MFRCIHFTRSVVWLHCYLFCLYNIYVDTFCKKQKKKKKKKKKKQQKAKKKKKKKKKNKNKQTSIPQIQTLCERNPEQSPKIYVKIPRKCHNHEAQTSRGTKTRRDEEQIRTPQTPHMKPQTHKEKRNATALERSVGKLFWGRGGDYWGLKLIFTRPKPNT